MMEGKSSRAMSMDSLQRVLEEIERRKTFLLTSHARPDGDAIGSALALASILGKMGKNARIVLSDSVPVIYKRLPCSDTIIQSSQVSAHCDAVILLECDSLQRTRIRGLEQQFLISIDHHSTSRAFAHLNWIDPRACATAEMVHKLAIAGRVPITPEMATCLYTAVLTDTGSFCYAPTNAQTFDLAKQLVEH